MKRGILVVMVAFSLLFSSCSIEDDAPNFHFTALSITNAEVPESFVLNQTYKINVTYLLPNGCTSYEGFDVSNEDITTRNVVVVGAVHTDAVSCTEQVIEQEASFNFVVIYNEPYTFKFYQGDNSDGEPEFLEIVVPVE
ncbi:hypothetical protein ACOCEA_04230 [Maribacter sp. CXY002]|uniref:hypothetical protein n=1 Tax=Maribacter luteocoastalis TaxID=3407671 RepID=UPI003B67D2BA